MFINVQCNEENDRLGYDAVYIAEQVLRLWLQDSSEDGAMQQPTGLYVASQCLYVSMKQLENQQMDCWKILRNQNKKHSFSAVNSTKRHNDDDE